MIHIIGVKILDQMQCMVVEYLQRGEVVTRLMVIGVMEMKDKMESHEVDHQEVVVLVEWAQGVLLSSDLMVSLCHKIMMVHRVHLDTERMVGKVLPEVELVLVGTQLVMMEELLIMKVLQTLEEVEEWKGSLEMLMMMTNPRLGNIRKVSQKRKSIENKLMNLLRLH